MNQRKVLLAGATGLVGGEILQGLLADATVAEVHVLARRAIGVTHPKLQLQLVDFRQLPALPQVDEVYLALGTTIRVAGSQEAFRAVDFEANLAVAKAAIASGVRRIGLVSAADANARSSVFYLSVKGALEDALTRLNLSALVIARPSLLLGNRDALNQPPRLGEKISTPILKLLAPLLPKRLRPVHARAVARSLLATLPTARGTVILHFDDLIRIGGSA
ncbi:MAG: NAD(P)H-binding protein [Steroidobacter sp.]